MASGQDDQEHLEDIRNEIRQLQSEFAKKKEDLERSEKDRKETKQQLDGIEEQQRQTQDDLDIERRKIQKDSLESQHGLAEAAKQAYMENKVVDLLGKRIPMLMKTIEEEVDEVDAGQFEGKDKQEEKDKKKANSVHNTVLVSYVNMGSDDYQVAFKIDKDISVWQLHRDACSYWACSHKEYVLCKIDKEEAVEPLWDNEEEDAQDKKNIKVQDAQVLNPAEKAQLHLVTWEEVEKFSQKFAEARIKLKEQEQKLLQNLAAGQTQDKAADASTIKTLRHGLGYAVPEKVAEPFVEALKPWPGIYSLLKTRDRREQKWARARLADWNMFAVLIVLNLSCIVLRNSHNEYILRQGVVDTLGHGHHGETWGLPVVDFEHIEHHEELWDWLRGSFHYQLYHENSTLRRFYKPVGYLRLRQQRAKEKPCAGRSIPENLQKKCYELQVAPNLQSKLSLLPKASDDLEEFLEREEHTGWDHHYDPNTWMPADSSFADLYGRIQSYDSSGYMILYNLSEAVSWDQWRGDVDFIRTVWTSPQTRMLALEMTLANYNLGGFISANFLIEITASGAVSVCMDVMPFHVFKTGGDKVADVLDYVRLTIAIVYVGMLRLYTKIKERVSQGRWGIFYLFSFGGVVDFLVVGAVVYMEYLRIQGFPPDPTSLRVFYSYARAAQDAELLGIWEAVLLLLLTAKFVTFMRISPTIFRFFKLFAKSLSMFAYFMLVFIPIVFGAAVLANAIWSPFMFEFSSWSRTLTTVLLATYQPFVQGLKMQETGHGWALPFLAYFFVSTTAFTVHTFLAITVHSYFEVELTEGADRKKEQWSQDQWLDWALWPGVFERVTGKKPGASRKLGLYEAEEASESSSSSDSEEEK